MTSRLLLLDGIRGVAAITVLGYHLHTVYGGFDQFRFGYLFVDIFFVLSGFVMSRTYEPRFASGMTPVQFFAARFWRLWPTMAVGTTFGLLYFLGSGAELSAAMAMFAATLAFIPHAGPEPFALNRPAWSIFFEVVANLIHAIVLWRVGTRLIVLVAIAATIALLPYWTNGNFNVGNKANDFVGGFPRVLLGYSIGVLMSRRNVRIPPVPKLLAPSAKWVGSLSFPLYAVHYPILQIGKSFDLAPAWAAGASILVAWTVVLLGSLIKPHWRRSIAPYSTPSA